MHQQSHLTTQEGISRILQRILRFILVYSLWIVSWAITGLAAFYLLSVIEGLLFLKVNPWQLQAVRRFGFIILGMVWMGYITGSEWYCRSFLDLKKKVSPLFLYFAIEIAVLAAIFGAHLWLNSGL